MKVSKVAQPPTPVVSSNGSAPRVFALYLPHSTNFTKFTIWCAQMLYYFHEASHDDTAR